jgi:hypothetical protein
MYTGRPGVHHDGDGTTEGWFRAPDGGFVTTEPVASEDWMPLNDYPTAKPTYDFYDTTNAGKTVICNGILEWTRHNKPNTEFPGGSVTYHWHSRAPIASYLVEDSVGNYHLTERTADNGVRYYEAQDTAISPAQRKENLAIMNLQQNITRQSFNGADGRADPRDAAWPGLPPPFIPNGPWPARHPLAGAASGTPRAGGAGRRARSADARNGRTGSSRCAA